MYVELWRNHNFNVNVVPNYHLFVLGVFWSWSYPFVSLLLLGGPSGYVSSVPYSRLNPKWLWGPDCDTTFLSVQDVCRNPADIRGLGLCVSFEIDLPNYCHFKCQLVWHKKQQPLRQYVPGQQVFEWQSASVHWIFVKAVSVCSVRSTSFTN